MGAAAACRGAVGGAYRGPGSGLDRAAGIAARAAGGPAVPGRQRAGVRPVFLANLVFAQRFSGVESAGTAFAANLLGAMVGGTLEYVSLITGYQFLLIVA